VEKRYFAGTHRTRPPAETIAAVRPLLEPCGITRVADITGLDRIGIPVYMAIRPNSRSVSASQGKGLDHLSAKASAIMEAIELHHAENIGTPVRLQSFANLRREVRVADPTQLPGIRESVFSAHWPIPWVCGLDLCTGEPSWVPFELVHADATVPPVPGSGCFDRGTNGLASGNTLAEAVLHGLCEVIERDALAVWKHLTAQQRECRRVALDEVPDPVASLLNRLTEADIRTVAWDVTSDIGVPAFRALIFDARSDPLLNPAGAAFGAGCHLDPVVAMTRALTEAAQSRLTAIAGSRDDLKSGYYQPEQLTAALDYLARLSGEPAPTVHFDPTATLATATPDGDVDAVLELLGRTGLSSTIVVDLSMPGAAVHVVRVVVPGLEGPTASPVYRPGPRVRALAGS
jgi:YcaO-like protein with predicted kinase domain